MNLMHWLVPWEPSVLVVVCVLTAAILYLRGMRRSRVASWPRQLAWWLGLAIIYVGLHTHLDYYAEHQFFIHRLQHMGLHHMGPFLIMLARPGPVLRRGLPLAFRARIMRPLLAWPPVRLALDILFQPLIASVLFVGLIYLWLIPSIHFVAMLDVVWYKVMNYSMTVDGLLFWWLVLDRRPHPPARRAPGTRILTALAVIPPQIAIGAYITFAGHDLFSVYDVCGRVLLDVSAATDQYIGGLILWVPSSMMSVVAALVAFHSWIDLDRRGRLRKRGNRRSGARQPGPA